MIEHLNLAVFVAGHQQRNLVFSVPLDVAVLLVNPCLMRNRGFSEYKLNLLAGQGDLLSYTSWDLQAGTFFLSS